MRIKIDQDRCQGHNLCLTYVSDLLETDDEGYVTERNDGHVPSELRGAAETAAANCPEYAISIEAD